MKTLIMAIAALLAVSVQAVNLHSTAFSTFRNTAGIPASVGARTTFGSDDWFLGDEMPSVRATPEVVSAIYHTLDAALERRFYASELTNDWDLAVYGPRDPWTAYFHRPEGCEDYECYASPQPGVSLDSLTNRTIITRRFVEGENIAHNLLAFRLFAETGWWATGPDWLVRPLISGTQLLETYWTSTNLVNMLSQEPIPDTGWLHAPQITSISSNSFPVFYGFAADDYGALTPPGQNGFLIRRLYPETHCFGNADDIADRRGFLDLRHNPRGKLPINAADFIARNYSVSAYLSMTNPVTRRLDHNLAGNLAAYNQWLGMMDRTYSIAEDAMTTSDAVCTRYSREMTAIGIVSNVDFNATWSRGPYGYELNQDIPIESFSVSLITNKSIQTEASTTPRNCSAWVHLSDSGTIKQAVQYIPVFSTTVDEDFLENVGQWSGSPSTGRQVLYAHAVDYYDTVNIQVRANGGALCTYFATMPTNLDVKVSFDVSRDYIAERSIEHLWPYNWQPGRRAAADNIAHDATLWGLHSRAYDDVFREINDPPQSNIGSILLRGTHETAAGVKPILDGWYDTIFNHCRTITGYSADDPWARIHYTEDQGVGVLEGAKIDSSIYATWGMASDGHSYYIDCDIQYDQDGMHVTIFRITDEHGKEASGATFGISFSAGAECVTTGSRSFDPVAPCSADVRSSVIQQIDYRFKSVVP